MNSATVVIDTNPDDIGGKRPWLACWVSDVSDDGMILRGDDPVALLRGVVRHVHESGFSPTRLFVTTSALKRSNGLIIERIAEEARDVMPGVKAEIRTIGADSLRMAALTVLANASEYLSNDDRPTVDPDEIIPGSTLVITFGDDLEIKRVVVRMQT